MTNEDVFLLTLVRLGIHSEADLESTPADIDWQALSDLAGKQGVVAIAWDGYSRLYEAGMVTVDMDKQIKKQWIGRVIQTHEWKYPTYRATIGHLASFYEKHGIKMMVLKGYGLSLNYPNPAHRPCGDVDIWNYGEYKRADKALHDDLGIKIDNSHHHHTVFHFEGQMFENHYDFVNIYAHPSSKVVEKRLKELASRGDEEIEIDGLRVYLPNPDFNALFLLRHTSAHFAAEKMSLRQILDWGTFVQRYHDRIDWNGLVSFVDGVGMRPFMDVLDGICVDYLGFPAILFPSGRSDEESRVVEDLFAPEFSDKNPKGHFFGSLLWRYRRWKHNDWKHRLVYPESLLRTFFAQLKAHLMKPASLRM